MLLSVVIPMYNEKDAVSSCFRQLTGMLEEWAASSSRKYEILFCDDGSTDGCGEIVRSRTAETALSYGSVRLIRQERNRGKGAAVRMGMLAAAGDWILFTDCDLAYGCRVIPEMLAVAEKAGVGVLTGSRAIGADGYAGYSPIRKLASRMYVKLLGAAVGFRHTDSQCGIKLFRRDAAQAVFSAAESDGWAFDAEILLLSEKMGFAVREYPVQVQNRRSGRSKVRLLRDSGIMLREAMRIRKRVDARFPEADQSE